MACLPPAAAFTIPALLPCHPAYHASCIVMEGVDDVDNFGSSVTTTLMAFVVTLQDVRLLWRCDDIDQVETDGG